MPVQFVINGIAAGAAIALVAMGFGLIYTTTRVFHMAHGAVYLAGAYVAYVCIDTLGLGAPTAVCCAIVASALLGMTIERCFYRPLRRRQAPDVVLLLCSLGLLVAIQNLIALVFGNQTLMLREGGPDAVFDVLGGRITLTQVIIISVSIVVALAMWAGLRLTATGRMIRAVASDPELATIVGLPSNRAMLIAVAAGSAVAGLAGVLVGYEQNLSPMMGFSGLLVGIVAAIIGGAGTVGGDPIGRIPGRPGDALRCVEAANAMATSDRLHCPDRLPARAATRYSRQARQNDNDLRWTTPSTS